MYVTYILLGITVVVSFYAWNDPNVMRKLILNPYTVNSRNEFHRFITSGFIHQDHTHLLMNGISLYFFGTAVEEVFAFYFGDMGTLNFILLYILGIIVSDIPTYMKNKGNPAYNSLGASGGVSSIIFAFILFRPLDKINLYFIIGIPGFILGTLYIIFSYYQGKKSNDNINHDAHLYGALFGLIFCIVLYPQVLPLFLEQVKAWRF
jgi:membrane associated rhomboid family serine protease